KFKVTTRSQWHTLDACFSKMPEHLPPWPGPKLGLLTLAPRIQMTPRLVIYLAKSMAAQTRHGAQIQQNASCGVSVQAMAGGRRIYAPGSRMAPRWSSVASPWTLMNGMS